MASVENITTSLRPSTKSRADRPTASWQYDLAMSLLLLWMISGAYLDGWAHNHIGDDIETFFTPWHAALYSGFGMVMLLTFGTWLRNISQGYRMQRAMPGGYELSLIGAALFGLAGIGDMIWHTLFGIELNIEAAFSPTHQLLLISMVMLAFGPLRSAMRKNDAPGSLLSFLPATLSITLAIAGLQFLFQSMNLFVAPYATSPYAADAISQADTLQSLGIASGILQGALLVGIALLCIRRWGSNLPFGVFSIVYTLNGIGLATQRDEYRLIPAMLIAGLTADLIIRFMRPSDERRAAVRIFAIAVPLILFTGYFVTLAFTSDLWWSIHTIGGVAVSAAGAALLVSYLAFPPVSQPE